MPEQINEIISVFKKQAIFNDLTDAQLTILATLAKKVSYAKNKMVFEEGDQTSNTFILLKGTVEVIKNSKDKAQQFVIAKIEKNNLFGEMSFIDNAPRSSTVKTVAPCELLIIDREMLQHNQDILTIIITNIAKINISRLRNTNENYVKTLQDQLEQVSLRNEFGKFFVVVIIIFGMGNFINKLIETFTVNTAANWFNWTYLFVLLVPIGFFIRVFHYPLSMFGVTLQGWKDALREALLVSVVTMAIMLAAYWLYATNYQPQLLSNLYNIHNPRVFTPFFFLYFIHSYLQEFISRGVIQSSLQRFFNDTKGTQSVVMTSALFGIFHLHVGFTLSFLTFLASLFFGWAYNRHKNLIGVTTIHFFLGMTLIYLGLM